MKGSFYRRLKEKVEKNGWIQEVLYPIPFCEMKITRFTGRF